MFVVITPVNLKRRTKKVIYPKKIEGIPCYSLDLPIIKGKPDWQGIISDQQFLLPIDITTPQNVKSYGSTEWKMKICSHIAEKQLKKTIQDMLFYDEKGEFIEEFMRLAPRAGHCTVFTSNRRMYENFCSNLYETNGCYVRINSMLGLKKGIAIAPDKNIVKISGFNYIIGDTLPENHINIPEDIASKLPVKVKNIDLAEALCCNCGIGNIDDYISNSIYP